MKKKSNGKPNTLEKKEPKVRMIGAKPEVAVKIKYTLKIKVRVQGHPTPHGVKVGYKTLKGSIRNTRNAVLGCECSVGRNGCNFGNHVSRILRQELPHEVAARRTETSQDESTTSGLPTTIKTQKGAIVVINHGSTCLCFFRLPATTSIPQPDSPTAQAEKCPAWD